MLYQRNLKRLHHTTGILVQDEPVFRTVRLASGRFSLELNLDLPTVEGLLSLVIRSIECYKRTENRHGGHLTLHQFHHILVFRVEILQSVRLLHDLLVDFHHQYGERHLFIHAHIFPAEYRIRLADALHPDRFRIVHRSLQCQFRHLDGTLLRLVGTTHEIKHTAPKQDNGDKYHNYLHSRSHIFTI